MTDWVRLWHDMPTDPKWRTIARKSGQRVGDVIAVFNFLMVNASGNTADRGALAGLDVEDVATALDIADSDVQAILAAMQGKVLDGERLTGWGKRQPKREDGTAAERKAAWKEREAEKRNASERIGTQGNAPETETETDIPLSNDNGAVDPEKLAFDSGIRLLTAAGKSPAQARTLIGKWKRDHGAPEVIAGIGEAVRLGITEPVGWMEARWKGRTGRAFDYAGGPC